jgi:hypothetical protein
MDQALPALSPQRHLRVCVLHLWFRSGNFRSYHGQVRVNRLREITSLQLGTDHSFQHLVFTALFSFLAPALYRCRWLDHACVHDCGSCTGRYCCAPITTPGVSASNARSNKPRSTNKQILFPRLVHFTHEVREEHDMIGLSRIAE